MMTTLLRVAGLLLAIEGVAAAPLGFRANDDIQGLENQIYKDTAEQARPGGQKEAATKSIAESEQRINGKKIERNLWFGGALVAVVVGICMALLPASGKRKAPAAEQAAAPNPGPAGP
jgi:hypothetical protein